MKLDTMLIRSYQTRDAREVADLFTQSIHHIESNYYSSDEKTAWAPNPPNYQFWSARLGRTQPSLAMINQRIVGFIEIDNRGYVDCLYIHYQYQRMGIANQLLTYAITKAIKMDLKEIYVDASKVAKPFFLSQGFLLIKKNHVLKNGQRLVNYRMRKVL